LNSANLYRINPSLVLSGEMKQETQAVVTALVISYQVPDHDQ